MHRLLHRLKSSGRTRTCHLSRHFMDDVTLTTSAVSSRVAALQLHTLFCTEGDISNTTRDLRRSSHKRAKLSRQPVQRDHHQPAACPMALESWYVVVFPSVFRAGSCTKNTSNRTTVPCLWPKAFWACTTPKYR